jgi:pimeloyl-ACP methyl ester carboxylesterase
MTVTEHSNVNINGLNIAYRTAGNGPPVVLVHGTPAYSYLWRNIIPFLSPEFTVYAPDLPGFGDSDKPNDCDYSFEFYERTLDAFISKMKIDRCCLVIHDIGGPTGLLWAVRRPQRIERLVIIDTGVYKNLVHKFPWWLKLSFKIYLIPIVNKLLVSDWGIATIMKAGVARKEVMRGETLRQYIRPFKR